MRLDHTWLEALSGIKSLGSYFLYETHTRPAGVCEGRRRTQGVFPFRKRKQTTVPTHCSLLSKEPGHALEGKVMS